MTKFLKIGVIVLATLAIIGSIFIIQQKFANNSQIDLLQQEVVRLKDLSYQVELQNQIIEITTSTQEENKSNGNDTIGSMRSVMEVVNLFGEKIQAVPTGAGTPDEIIRQYVRQNYNGLLSNKYMRNGLAIPRKCQAERCLVHGQKG